MRRSAGWILVAALSVGSGTACVVAAASAGAGTGIYLTSGGAKSMVNGSVDQVAGRTERAFKDLSITTTKTTTEDGGARREFHGSTDDREVTVKLERQTDSTTNVEVTAKKNVAAHDKDYAKQVLEKIVAR